MCGENDNRMIRTTTSLGSSPRVRGKPVGLRARAISGGLIPACAGKTSQHRSSLELAWAHPRVCGENAKQLAADFASHGSSPRVRGKQVRAYAGVNREGLIPACAGKTPGRVFLVHVLGAHPRVCGENLVDSVNPLKALGSSPRVRGKRWLH